MIKLYQFNPLWGLPNISPFCLKVESYLRLANIDYKVRAMNNPYKAPKGKLPFIKDDEVVVTDSDLIIKYFSEKHKINLDEHLDYEQKIFSSFLSRVYSEHLYWMMLYFRWQHHSNWLRVKKDIFEHLPWFSKPFIPKIVQKKMKSQLYNQGMGRYTDDEVMHFARPVIDDISYILSKNNYTLSDQPSTIDASSYAFLANLIWTPLDDPLTNYAQKSQPIKIFCDRIKKIYFSDYQNQ